MAKSQLEVCKPVPITTCSWNTTECGRGFYCAISDYTTNGTCNESNTSYYTVGKGVCTKIPEKSTISFGSTKLYNYETEMNWWSASSLCNTNHSRLMIPSDLGIENGNTNGGTDYNTNAQPTSCPCGSNGGSCTFDSNTPVDEGCLALGNSCCGIDASGCCSSGICDCEIYLNEKFEDYGYWSANSFGNTSENACYAFIFYPNKNNMLIFVEKDRTYLSTKLNPLCR